MKKEDWWLTAVFDSLGFSMLEPIMLFCPPPIDDRCADKQRVSWRVVLIINEKPHTITSERFEAIYLPRRWPPELTRKEIAYLRKKIIRQVLEEIERIGDEQ